MAKLTKAAYKEILIPFPNLLNELKLGIYRYNDRMKRFIVENLQKVDYFKDIGNDALHDILYNLQAKKFQRNEILQEPGDNATSLFFLQDGVIEIFTKTENNHVFMLEKLFRGSIINHRTFFMEEGGQVYYRFGKASICSILTYETMEEVAGRHAVLRKKFNEYRKNTIMQDKPYPLDYIMNMPRHLRDHQVSEEVQLRAWRLENQLKNVVTRRLTEIRAVKDKPSMKDWIDEYLKQRGEKDERSRVRIKDQVLQIYEAKSFLALEENDPNFNRVIVHIERVLKITTAQTLGIDSLERKIMGLSKRHQLDQNDLVVPKKNIQAIAEQAKDATKGPSEESENSDDQVSSGKLSKNKKPETKFRDLFTDIKEDHFESSDDGEEKRRNRRLDRLAEAQ